MAKIIARNASLGLDDSSGTCRAFGGFNNQISLSWTAESPESTGFGDVSTQRLSGGLQDYQLTANVYFATGANESDVVLSGLIGGSSRFAFGPSGSTSGCILYTGCVILSDYSMDFALADAATAALTLVARSGSLTRTTWT